jgi:hypothetical protein
MPRRGFHSSPGRASPELAQVVPRLVVTSLVSRALLSQAHQEQRARRALQGQCLSFRAGTGRVLTPQFLRYVLHQRKAVSSCKEGAPRVDHLVGRYEWGWRARLFASGPCTASNDRSGSLTNKRLEVLAKLAQRMIRIVQPVAGNFEPAPHSIRGKHQVDHPAKLERDEFFDDSGAVAW